MLPYSEIKVDTDLPSCKSLDLAWVRSQNRRQENKHTHMYIMIGTCSLKTLCMCSFNNDSNTQNTNVNMLIHMLYKFNMKPLFHSTMIKTRKTRKCSQIINTLLLTSSLVQSFTIPYVTTLILVHSYDL